MKKRSVLGIGLVILVSLVVAPFIQRKIQSTITVQETFKSTKAADFYTVSTDGLRAFEIKGSKIKQLNYNKLDLANNPSPTIGKAEIDNRYLVFSDQDGSPWRGINRPTISIDFEKGKIIKTPTPYDPYSGSGYSEKYYYTHQATTEDSGIYKFDKFGKQVDSYTFDFMSLGNSKFVGNSGKLYLSVARDPKSGKDMDNHENTLLVFDEKPKLKLVKELFLEDNPSYTYMPNAIEQAGDSIYLVITGRRDRVSKERLPDNRLMVINKADYQKRFITLAEDYPSEIFRSRDDTYLFVTHPSVMIGRSVLSVYHIPTGNQFQIDLSEQMGITDKTDKYTSDVVSVSTSKDGRQLFILTHGGIFVYDFSTQALVSKLSIDDSDAQQIYMWTNR